MKISKRFWLGPAAVLCLTILILDTKTAITGVSEGLALCYRSIVPALFPFCILSKIITASMLGSHMSLLRPIGKLCGIPLGGEAIFLLSFLGGYPVGAQSISDAYRCGAISKKDARRMLGFCNNAGPSFLFGILGSLFESTRPIWCILIIHILSALIVGCILPEKSKDTCVLKTQQTASLSGILQESIKTMALICGWVIIFRVILCYLQRWFLGILSEQTQIALTGILEISNGCIALHLLKRNGLQFILGTGFLTFGGLCVYMQTRSVTSIIGKSRYLTGKILQTSISLLFAFSMQHLLFGHGEICYIPVWVYLCCIGIIATTLFFLYREKKVVAFA